ncbi:Uu.00g041510.m01.CDS01 [Anthostomella pinea]|uniref:Uu.00g041510.m01.CDS01 n=1 Tax=Anthostomella pinea TaxID=933095 RepID=A0AAI8VAI9_9PEZI|nr:Uu.00g041510.m01.CDS01 [Anthostomella pinea]
MTNIVQRRYQRTGSATSGVLTPTASSQTTQPAESTAGFISAGAFAGSTVGAAAGIGLIGFSVVMWRERKWRKVASDLRAEKDAFAKQAESGSEPGSGAGSGFVAGPGSGFGPSGSAVGSAPAERYYQGGHQAEGLGISPAAVDNRAVSAGAVLPAQAAEVSSFNYPMPQLEDTQLEGPQQDENGRKYRIA